MTRKRSKINVDVAYEIPAERVFKGRMSWGSFEGSDTASVSGPCNDFYGTEPEDREKEKIISQFCAKLVDEYDYPMSFVVLKKYQEIQDAADITVLDIYHEPMILIEVEDHKRYQDNQDRVLKKLFKIAKNNSEHIKYLMYYTHYLYRKEYRVKQVIIDYKKYSTMAKWKHDGCLSEKDILKSQHKYLLS